MKRKPVTAAIAGTSTSELELLSAIEMQDRALQQMQDKNWQAAAGTYAAIVAANPHSASHWFNYGYTLDKCGRFQESILAMDRAIALGFGFDNKLWRRYVFVEEWWRSFGPKINAPWYMMARAQSMLGRKQEALASLARALDGGFADQPALHAEPDLAPLRDDPGYQARFRSLVGIAPEGLSRNEKWRYDLRFLARRLEQIHYAPYRMVSRREFRATFNRLSEDVPNLTDSQVITEITRILAGMGDGHMGIEWPREMADFPIEFRLYSDGLFVYRAPGPLAEAVGCRVVSIGGHDAEEVLKAVAPFCCVDNAMGLKKQASWRAANPHVLSALNLIHDREHVPLVLRGSDGELFTVVLSHKLEDKGPWEPWRFINSHASTPLPSSLNVHDTVWFEPLPQANLVYCQCNAIADPLEESFATFFRRMLAFIESEKVDYLVIDLRNNNGGDSGLNRGLIHALIRCDRVNRRGHLFVLIGRYTFSAAQNLTSDLERETEAIFVGEPSGSRPNFVGQTTLFKLPCCGLVVACSSLYHQGAGISCDFRTWVEPDIVAEMSSEDAANNHDPAMEAVLKEISSRRAAQETDD